MSPRASASLRLSLFYAGVFSAVGIHLPYWPVWLKAQGLDAGEIGAALAVTFFARVLTNPVAGHVVDRLGERRRPLVVLAFGTLASFLLFAVTDGFWQLLVVTFISGGLFAALMPIGDNLSLLTCAERRLDYGRVRLWGSLSFIAASSAGGALLAQWSPESVLWMVVAGLALTVLAAMMLPDTRPPESAPGKAPPSGALLGSPTFLLFLLSTSLLQTSHMIYYAFGTLHWQAAGLSEATIGWLWAEGVIAEVALFAFSGAVVAWLGPGRLLLLAGLGGVIRWTVTAATAEPAVLAVAQLLHALTFGALHLGAMHFIVRAAPPGFSARAQTLYASISVGIAGGLAMLSAGFLYEQLGGASYLVTAGLSAAGAGTAVLLLRRWQGGAMAAVASSRQA